MRVCTYIHKCKGPLSPKLTPDKTLIVIRKHINRQDSLDYTTTSVIGHLLLCPQIQCEEVPLYLKCTRKYVSVSRITPRRKLWWSHRHLTREEVLLCVRISSVKGNIGFKKHSQEETMTISTGISWEEGRKTCHWIRQASWTKEAVMNPTMYVCYISHISHVHPIRMKLCRYNESHRHFNHNLALTYCTKDNRNPRTVNTYIHSQ